MRMIKRLKYKNIIILVLVIGILNIGVSNIKYKSKVADLESRLSASTDIGIELREEVDTLAEELKELRSSEHLLKLKVLDLKHQINEAAQ